MNVLDDFIIDFCLSPMLSPEQTHRKNMMGNSFYCFDSAGLWSRDKAFTDLTDFDSSSVEIRCINSFSIKSLSCQFHSFFYAFPP
jgi:hypothetical protein